MMRNIGDFEISSDKVFLIGEIGINHNGDVAIVKRLVDAAKAAGFNAVKLQKRALDVVYTQQELAQPRKVDRSILEKALERGVLPDSSINRLKESDFSDSINGDLKISLEFTINEYEEIDAYCKHVGVMWFATCFDEASVDVIARFNPPVFKVASFFLTDDHLLKYTASFGKPIILSTGMSTFEQIDQAVKIVGSDKLMILHCTSMYPTQPKDINLSVMSKIRNRYNVPVGYSGHESGWHLTFAAVVMGACVIERHITLSRDMPGSDHKISIIPSEMSDLSHAISDFYQAKGDGVKRVLDGEIVNMKKYRRIG